MNIGIIGYGYWGKNLVRNFVAQKNATVKTVLDFDSKKLEALKAAYPNIHTTSSVEEFFNDDSIHAIVVATPVSSHYELAKKGLLAGKHVLIEKPMTASYVHAKELMEIADSKGLVLMVDHTFLYTSAVEKIKELIDHGELGEIRYIDSTRINLGLFQPDVNVLWDLAAHDISICNYLLNEYPVSLQATGISHTNNDIENIAYLTLKYASNKIAHFNCSWSSPVKVRQMLIGGDKKMIVWNDLEATEKIKVYDTGYDMKSDEDKTKILVDYRVGDIYVPKLNNTEALYSMASDFIDSIQKQKQPKASASIGAEVVKILEGSQKYIKQLNDTNSII
ncbi:MAG: Gfo/Idh/MocA family oxidoreductase [Raineya sp.]|jgi:predicted dehydrogenase|nr:Gfo/Idh/MocA family oxidoreductase [Raineya sp.]